MHRFFTEPGNIRGGKVILTGGAVRHIHRVLRLSVGDRILVFDGSGKEYEVEITSVTSKQVTGQIIAQQKVNREEPIEIILAQSLPKSDKMDWIVQKSVELGLSKIIPMVSERTVVRLSPEKAEERRRRWQKIAKEAAEQSGRNVVPEVGEVLSFSQAVKEIEKPELALIFWEQEKTKSLREVLRKNREAKKVIVLIGPEGGFTEKEINLAKAAGAQVVSLGPRILRAETAAIISIALIVYELGTLNARSS